MLREVWTDVSEKLLKIIEKQDEHMPELVAQRSCGMCSLEDTLKLSGKNAEQPDVTFMFALVSMNLSTRLSSSIYGF